MSGVAIPGFWLGILLIILFGVNLGWLPPSGFVPILKEPIEALRLLVLPAFSLGVSMAALNMRQTRSAMLEVLAQEYVRTARAKGLRERSVIWVHALKNAMLPVITVIGIEFAFLIGGLVVTETVFNLPGVARFLVQSILWRDYPVVQNLVMFTAIIVILSNLVVDVLYGVLDPRVRYGG